MKYSINQDLQDFYEKNKWKINKLKGVDVYHYIEDNFKPSLPTTISWHIESLAYFTKKHRRTLAKIHKIKCENRVLSSRRKRLLNSEPNAVNYYVYILSERIGANGNRIQRLRTKLSQMKKEFNIHTT